MSKSTERKSQQLPPKERACVGPCCQPPEPLTTLLCQPENRPGQKSSIAVGQTLTSSSLSSIGVGYLAGRPRCMGETLRLGLTSSVSPAGGHHCYPGELSKG